MDEVTTKLDQILALLKADKQPGQETAPADEDKLFDRFRVRLLKDPAVLKVLARQPEIRIEMRHDTIDVNGDTLRGHLAQLIVDGAFDSPVSGNQATKEMKRRGWNHGGNNVSRDLQRLSGMGFLTIEDDGFQAVKDMKRNIRKVAVDEK